MRKVLGGLIFAVGLALLIVIWLFGGNEPCEHNPSVVLKGTFADCEAMNPPPKEAPGAFALNH